MIAVMFIMIESTSGVVILLSHRLLGTPKRITLFRFHPLVTGVNILQYENNWQEIYPVFGYVNRIYISDECNQTTDRYGFIHNGDKARIITPEKFTIFILGGSTVAGLGASCNDQTISAHLERLLQSRYKNIEVINAGVAGYFSAKELLRISNEILFYDPDIIIDIGGTNDFEHEISNYGGRKFTYFISEYDRQLFQTLKLTKSIKWSIGNLIYNLTKFTEFTYTRFVLEKGWAFLTGRAGSDSRENIIYNVKKIMKVYKSPAKNITHNERNLEIEMREKILYTTSYIKQANALVSGMGKKYYYILQPTLLTDTRKLPPMEKEALNIVKSEFSKKMGVDIVRHADYFWKGVDENLRNSSINYYNFTNIFPDKEEVYSDYVHYNDYGNLLIAKKLYQILINDRAIPQELILN